MAEHNPIELMLPADASAYLGGVSPETLQWWRRKRQGPPYQRIGRRILYRRADLEAWLESQRVDPADHGRAA